VIPGSQDEAELSEVRPGLAEEGGCHGAPFGGAEHHVLWQRGCFCRDGEHNIRVNARDRHRLDANRGVDSPQDGKSGSDWGDEIMKTIQSRKAYVKLQISACV